MSHLHLRAAVELIDSERSYLLHLDLIKRFFMDPLTHGRDENGSRLIEAKDFDRIFSHIPTICQVNCYLLSALEDRLCPDEYSPIAAEVNERVTDVFMWISPFLKFYATYVREFKSATNLLEHLCINSLRLKNFIRQQESRPEVGMKLNALLITPVQRIPRYCLILQDLIDKSPPDDVSIQSLRLALDQVEDIARFIDLQIYEAEKSHVMFRLQSLMPDLCQSVLRPDCRLIRFGRVAKYKSAATYGDTSVRHIFLFSDLIMVFKENPLLRLADMVKKVAADDNHLPQMLRHRTTMSLVDCYASDLGGGRFKLASASAGDAIFGPTDSLRDGEVKFVNEFGLVENWPATIQRACERLTDARRNALSHSDSYLDRPYPGHSSHFRMPPADHLSLDAEQSISKNIESRRSSLATIVGDNGPIAVIANTSTDIPLSQSADCDRLVHIANSTRQLTSESQSAFISQLMRRLLVFERFVISLGHDLWAKRGQVVMRKLSIICQSKGGSNMRRPAKMWSGLRSLLPSARRSPLPSKRHEIPVFRSPSL